MPPEIPGGSRQIIVGQTQIPKLALGRPGPSRERPTKPIKRLIVDESIPGLLTLRQKKKTTRFLINVAHLLLISINDNKSFSSSEN